MKYILLLFLIPSIAFSQMYKEQDKQLHFAAGNISGAVGYFYSYNKYQDKKRAMITGICTAFAAGVIKEMYDSSIKGNYLDFEDLAATTLGGITVNVTIPLFQTNKYKPKRKRRKPRSRGKCGR